MTLASILPTNREVTLNDGKTYRLAKMTANVEASISEYFKFDLLDEVEPGKSGLQLVLDKVRINAAARRRVLYLFLRREYKELTEDQVGDLIDMGNYLDVINNIVMACCQGLPNFDEKKKEALENFVEILSTGN
jgi:hypothetical protein